MFLLFIFFVIVTYLLFDGDVLAPSFIFCVMYTFSIGCALVNYQSWGLNIITLQLFEIYIFGALIMIFMGVLLKFIFCRNYHIPSENGMKEIKVNNFVTFFFIFFNLITLVLWVINVYKIAGGGSSFGNIMESFRMKTSYSFEVTMPGYLTQMVKIVTATGYIFSFIYINNLLAHKRNFLLLINPLLYLLLSLFSSDRLNFLEYIATIVVYYYLLVSVKKNLRRKSIKLVIKLILVFIGVLVAFYSIRLLVGRNDSKSAGLIEYITMYAGGPVKLFDLFLQQPIRSSFWGKETFIAVNQTFNKLGLFNIPQYLVHKEFRLYNGILLGNVYSAYRNWYADFGFNGTMILQTLFSLFFNFFYYRLRSTKYYDSGKFGIIIYGYMASGVFLHPIDDEFYRYTISIGFLIYMVVFLTIYILTIKKMKVKL